MREIATSQYDDPVTVEVRLLPPAPMCFEILGGLMAIDLPNTDVIEIDLAAIETSVVSHLASAFTASEFIKCCGADAVVIGTTMHEIILIDFKTSNSTLRDLEVIRRRKKQYKNYIIDNISLIHERDVPLIQKANDQGRALGFDKSHLRLSGKKGGRKRRWS